MTLFPDSLKHDFRNADLSALDVAVPHYIHGPLEHDQWLTYIKQLDVGRVITKLGEAMDQFMTLVSAVPDPANIETDTARQIFAKWLSAHLAANVVIQHLYVTPPPGVTKDYGSEFIQATKFINAMLKEVQSSLLPEWEERSRNFPAADHLVGALTSRHFSDLLSQTEYGYERLEP